MTTHSQLPGRLIELDVDFVRSQFPAFEEPSLRGWAHFENAGGSYACRQVIDRLSSFYRRTKVQPYYPFPASESAGEAMDAAYTSLAGYLNVAEEDVHLGPSTSQNTYVLASAVGAVWGAGDEIVVSNQDHEANAGVWRRLEGSGTSIREWGIDPETAELDVEQLDELVSSRTRLVAFPHCSNIVAHPNPVREIVDRVKSVAPDAMVLVDGVSYAPHGLPDVASLGADVYLFSLYKTWGPHLGVMTIKRDLADRLENQSHFFNAKDVRKRLLPAGPDHAQIAAAAGVPEYLDTVWEYHAANASLAEAGSVGPAERGRQLHELFVRYETRLLERLLGWLGQRDDVRIVGPTEAARRAPTVSFVPLRKSVGEVLGGLTSHKVMAGSGHFYGVRPLGALGIDGDPGVVRLSFVHYTTLGEIEQLISALEAVLGG